MCCGGTHIHTLAFLPEYVHPGPCLETAVPGLGALWWRPEEVQFPVLALDLQLEMAACYNFQGVLGQRVSFFPGPAWKSRGSSDIRRESSGPVQGSSSSWTSVRM